MRSVAVALVLLVLGIGMILTGGRYVTAHREVAGEAVEARVVALARPGEELGVVELEGVMRPASVPAGARVGAQQRYTRSLEDGRIVVGELPRVPVHPGLTASWFAAMLALSTGVVGVIAGMSRLGGTLRGDEGAVAAGDDGQP